MMNAPAATAILDHLSVLGDVTRSRILLVLDRHELTVADLCAVLQAPQSTISRHLKALLDCGWVTARAEGTSRLYRSARETMDPAARRLWQLVGEQVAGAPSAVQDGRRLERVLTERRTKSQEFFTSSAGQWDRLREELLAGASISLRCSACSTSRGWWAISAAARGRLPRRSRPVSGG